MATTSTATQIIFSKSATKKLTSSNKVWIVPQATTIVPSTSHRTVEKSLSIELRLNNISSSAEIGDHHTIIDAIHRCMEETEISHVDLLLVEFPSHVYSNLEQLKLVWQEVEKYVTVGLVKQLGLLNPVDHREIAKVLQVCTYVRPSTVQIHYQPLNAQLSRFVKYCKENGIRVVAGGKCTRENAAWSIKYNVTLPQHSLLPTVGHISSSEITTN